MAPKFEINIKQIVVGIVSTLITAYIGWLSYTVVELNKSCSLQEYKIIEIHKILQDVSEQIYK